jgi:glycosyltransferase involved in cell wall biosynthesis
MRPLRIVLVMIEPPVPFGNAASRWFSVLLTGLVERGHRVTAYAACSKAKELDEARALFPAPAYDLRLYPFPVRRGLAARFETLRRPYSYMFGPDLRADLARALAEPFDVLHLEQLSSGWVGLDHVERALLNVHFLYSIDLAEADLGRGGWFQKFQMRQLERMLLRRYPRVGCLSDRLADAVCAISPRSETFVVPLGIDPARYEFIPAERRPVEPVVSLIGSMTWHPSRSAAVRLLNAIWPRIHRQVPAARLEIVGWGARSALADFVDRPGVTIAENVPDAHPYFERAGVMVYAPGRGSGMKVKVMEAFALGVPVVTTAEGVEGIPARDGVHAGICEDDAGLADRAVRLLTDRATAERQRTAARALLEQHCGPGPTLDALERVYERIAGRDPA